MTTERIELTGSDYAGSGVCWWCGGELPPRRRRWCCDDHWKIYYAHYMWRFARPWCLERYLFRCANCGKQLMYSRFENIKYADDQPYGTAPTGFVRHLEAHHIDPLDGEIRFVNIKNCPDNLIPFCSGCHVEVGEAYRWGLRVDRVRNQAPYINQLPLGNIWESEFRALTIK